MEFLIPTIAYAAEPLSVKQLMFRISYYILNPLIILGFVIALVYFIWGLVSFLKNRQSNATSSNEGKDHMLWGIVGLFIMVSAFAIMQVLADIVGAKNAKTYDITSELPQK
jgi:predicted small integral membrane protein